MNELNEQLIEIVLMLFWTGFIGLNLWLWKARPLEQAAIALSVNHEDEVKQGEPHATVHH